jgi:hypothetical protein
VKRHYDFQLCSSICSSVEANRSAQRHDPLAHAGQTHVAGKLQPLRAQVRRPSPIIAYSKPYLVLADGYGYVNRTGSGMPQHIRETFLQGAEQRKLSLSGERRHNGRCI